MQCGTSRQAFRDALLVPKRRIELFGSLPVEKLSRLALQHQVQRIADEAARTRPGRKAGRRFEWIRSVTSGPMPPMRFDLGGTPASATHAHTVAWPEVLRHLRYGMAIGAA